jgi:microcystin degradation protein MlrC
VVGIASTAAWAAGRITTECWGWLLEEYVGRIAQLHAEDGGLDGIYLVLHGAMIVDGLDDPEGELLKRVRDVVGSTVPVVASYDIHAHLTPEMCDRADATVFFHTSPHIDIVETGTRSAAVLLALLHGAEPATVLIKLPVVLPVERANTQPTPDQAADCAAFPPIGKARVTALEAQPWCLSAGICYPQPWMNLRDLASGVVITVDRTHLGAVGKAKAAATELARALFAAREEFMPIAGSVVDYVEAVQRAFEHHTHTDSSSSNSSSSRHRRRRRSKSLVVIGDGVDSTNAGAPGDSNHLLGELLKYVLSMKSFSSKLCDSATSSIDRYNWPGKGAMSPMVSPSGVAEAEAAGEGASLSIALGGVFDTVFSGPPMPVQVRGVPYDALLMRRARHY